MSRMDDTALECIHGLQPGTCAIGKRGPTTANSRIPRSNTTAEQLTSAQSVEKYRTRYTAERQSTFDAYVQVFFSGTAEARAFPGGWTLFSRSANAEPALVRDQPDLVQRAEQIMTAAGFRSDDSGRPGRGRRWVKVRSIGGERCSALEVYSP